MTEDKKIEDAAFIERMNAIAKKVGNVNALAKKAGISQGGIRRYFSGGEPSRIQLIALAKAADVSVAWLAGEEDEKKQSSAISALPDKSMQEMAQWISEQNDGINYWEVAKAKLAKEFPEFKEWLKTTRLKSNLVSK